MGRVTVTIRLYEDPDAFKDDNYAAFLAEPPESKQNMPISIPRWCIISTVPYQEPLPTIPGTAIWANTRDNPQANLEAFFLIATDLWLNSVGAGYKPEEIHTWKPYSEHTPDETRP